MKSELTESKQIEKYVLNTLLRYGYKLESKSDQISIRVDDENFKSISQKYYIGLFILIVIALILTFKILGFAFLIIGGLLFLGKDIFNQISQNSFQTSNIKELSIFAEEIEIRTKDGKTIPLMKSNIQSLDFKLPYDGNPYESIFYAELEDSIYEIFKLVSDNRSTLDSDSKLLNKYLNLNVKNTSSNK